MRPLCVALLMLAAFSGRALAWGYEGHRVIAELAERYLEPQANGQIRDLLAIENATTLAEVFDLGGRNPRPAPGDSTMALRQHPYPPARGSTGRL